MDISQLPFERVHQEIDALFRRDADVFGEDLAAYRGHVQRVAGLIGLQFPVGVETCRPVAVAVYFHDSAVWYDQTWDYLPQSRRRALAELRPEEQGFSSVVDAMIDEHHRIRRARHPHPLVEAMRRADAADITGIPALARVRRDEYGQLLTRYPRAGFHRVLLRAWRRGVRESVFRPAPMLKF